MLYIRLNRIDSFFKSSHLDVLNFYSISIAFLLQQNPNIHARTHARIQNMYIE